MFRRQLLMMKLAGLLLFALVLTLNPGCRSSNQNSPHKLLVYTPHGQDMLRDFVARYKQLHPEVEDQFLDMGSREVLERLRGERNLPQAHLWSGATETNFQT